MKWLQENVSCLQVAINKLKWYEKIQWILLLLVLFFSFFTMCYDDAVYIAVHSHAMLKLLAEGHVIQGSQLLFSSNYGFTLWLVYMVWNIPMLLVNWIVGDRFYMDRVGPMLWDKLLLVVVTVFLVKAMLRIARLYGMKKELEIGMIFVTLSSAFYAITVLQLNQCDIIGVTFALWGIVYYLKGENKKFLLLFAIANPMKYLSILIFVPLVLLRNKKIISACTWLISGNILVVFNILMRRILSGQWAQDFNGQVISNLLGNKQVPEVVAPPVVEQVVEEVERVQQIFIENPAIPELPIYLGNIVAGVSIFILLYGLICIAAYAIKEEKIVSKWAIYLPFLVYLNMIVFYDTPAYRMVVLCPFLILLIFIDKKYYNLSLILELAMGAAIMLIKLYDAAWVIGGPNTFNHLVLKGKSTGFHLNGMVYDVLGMESFIGIFYTVFVAAALGFAVLHVPFLQKEDNIEHEKTEQVLIWARVLFIVGWTGLTVYSLIIF